MAKKYYKVVDPHLKSSRIWGTIGNQQLETQYSVGNWTYPNVKNTNLMVFDTLKQARDFKSYYSDEKIFECEIKNPRKIGTLIRNGDFEEILEKILALKKAKKKWTHLVKPNTFPEGTVFCSAVKLLKEVA